MGGLIYLVGRGELKTTINYLIYILILSSYFVMEYSMEYIDVPALGCAVNLDKEDLILRKLTCYWLFKLLLPFYAFLFRFL